MAWTNKYSHRNANCEKQLIQEGNLCNRERDVCTVFLTSPTPVRECPPHAAKCWQCQEQSAGTPGPVALSPFPRAPVVRTSGWPRVSCIPDCPELWWEVENIT